MTESKTTQKPKKPAVKLVKMKRGEKTADVHPDMVEHYIAGGFEKV